MHNAPAVTESLLRGDATMQELGPTAEYYRPPTSYCVLGRKRNRVEPPVSGREERNDSLLLER
jgi:hypothetical protein